MTDNKVSVGELRANLADTINKVAYAHEEIVLVRRNKPIAKIVPYSKSEKTTDGK